MTIYQLCSCARGFNTDQRNSSLTKTELLTQGPLTGNFQPHLVVFIRGWCLSTYNENGSVLIWGPTILESEADTDIYIG